MDVVALAANSGVAWMLYRFRSGDANRRSVWIRSRNDAIGNVAVDAGRSWACSAPARRGRTLRIGLTQSP